MRAVVLHAPGPPDALQLTQLPDPAPAAGQVHIAVRAFGLNRSEMFTRQGHSPGVQLPRVLGIECVGTVISAPGSDLSPGQTVAALMGGMGRDFDGGYAEQTVVPRRCCFPLETTLPWVTLAAIPEMFQTVNGSLTTGLELGAGEVLLIRGGTSSIGLTAASLARARGASVVATTRKAARRDFLLDHGVDEVIIDDGHITTAVRERFPDGVDKVLELVGTATLKDSLRCARPGGVVCMTGILGNAWALDGFQPMIDIPTGVRLTSYSGGPADLDLAQLQDFVNRVEAGEITIRIARQWGLHQLPDAHALMEGAGAGGKMVVSTD